MSARFDPARLAVYLVTDTPQCEPLGVVETVRRAIAGGATLVQLRDPDASDEEFVRVGRALLDVCGDVPLILDDRVHLVEAVGAAGVHVGQSDTPPQRARELLGPDRIVGLSVSDEAQLNEANALPPGTVDYLGLSPVRATASKPGHAAPMGFAEASRLARLSAYPTCAIGGITASDAAAIKTSGIDGMAVISAICGPPDPRAATAELAAAWRAAPRVANVLSIAGSDPSGGAGVQADLKSISANGGYGMCAIVALTAQNTRGVTGIHAVPLDFVRAQLDALVDDVRIDAIKIGMLASAELARTVGEYLSGPFAGIPLVLDPVMVATSGDRLLEEDAVAAVRSLLPLADLITPNLPEAAVLLETSPAGSLDELTCQAEALLALGARGVYAKGGHFEVGGSSAGRSAEGVDAAAQVSDVVLVDGERLVLSASFIDTPNTHGTGCSLSSALAALRLQRPDWSTTARDAKAWLSAAIAEADTLSVGRGHGPVHHFHALWGRG